MTERQIHTQKQVGRFLLQLIFPRVGGENRGEQILFSAFAAVASYLFAGAEALFGSCPFGLALIAASRDRVFLSYFGAIAGILAVGGNTAPIYIVLYTLLLLFRFVASVPREPGKIMPACKAFFHEAPQLRVAAAVFGGSTAGLYELFLGGTGLMSVLYSVTMILSVPALTFLYLPYFECDFTLSELLGTRKYKLAERLESFGKAPGFWLDLSESVLGASLVFSLYGYKLFGFSFSFLAAAFLTLYVSYRRGGLSGAVMGAVAVAPTSILTAPAFAIFGFASGVLWQFGAFGAVLVAVFGEGLLLLLLGGLDGFLGAFPETLVAIAVGWPFAAGIRKREKARAAVGDTLVCYQQNTDLEHIKRLSQAFSELSGTFSSMAQYLRKPDHAETLALCRRVFAVRCSHCEKRESCPHITAPTMDESIKKLAAAITGGERELKNVFGEEQIRDCGYLGAILTDIMKESADAAREKQENGTGDLLAADYAMLSKILADTADGDRAEREEDKRLSGELCTSLEAQGGFRGNVTVFGARQKQILVAGSYWEGRRLSVDEIRSLFEQLCCCRLSEPVFDFSSGQMTMQTHTERRYDAEFISACLPGGGEMSGDMIRSFENAESYFYALLSDGMGSGKTACLTAELSGAYLSELLSAGVAADTALRMLNQVIRQKGSECSATIDLLELDLLYGKAAFVKSGAATSYVRRGNDVFRIRSKTIPIGILDAVDAEKIRFDIAAGDVVVMLSDGVSQIPEDAPWLISLLTDGWDKNLPTMADKILSAAKTAGRADDMTVGLIRISDHKCA